MTICNLCFQPGEHLDACPTKIQKIAMDFWQMGVAHGKAGLLPQDLNKTYLLGHGQGLRMKRGEAPLE